jgi:hypothetical protein
VEQAPPPQKPGIPSFKDDVGLTGYVDNRPFIEFLNKHDGGVVHLQLTVDASMAGGPATFLDERCPPDRADGKGPEDWPTPLFETMWSVPAVSPERMYELSQGAQPETDVEGSYLCSTHLRLHGPSASEMEWSSGGTGTITWRLNHFFRVNRTVSGTETTFTLNEVPATASEIAEAQAR